MGIDEKLDSAVERLRAEAVERHHAPARESKTPIHDAMCDYRDDDVIDAMSELLLPADDAGVLEVWNRARKGALAAEGSFASPSVRAEYAAEIGELIIQAAEDYVRRTL